MYDYTIIYNVLMYIHLHTELCEQWYAYRYIGEHFDVSCNVSKECLMQLCRHIRPFQVWNEVRLQTPSTMVV